jgi:hypothetical protein
MLKTGLKQGLKCGRKRGSGAYNPALLLKYFKACRRQTRLDTYVPQRLSELVIDGTQSIRRE